ncbi:MAG: hypothetical protein JST54_23890 [Deltaproteobacteria bacterium]|nr:hypothetical protein [Deltaproteobacteria bacterium]
MPTILRVYGECLARVPGDIARNVWVLILPVLASIAFAVLGSLLGALGIVGGFIMGLVECAIFASFLYFLDEVVSRSPTHIRELLTSVKRYFWPVMNVLFVLWIAQLVLGMVLSGLPNGGVIQMGIALVLFILLNATPEVIYQRRAWNGMDVIMGSVNFIQENWIEWFIPNLAFGAAAVFGVGPLASLLAMALGGFGLVATGVIVGALLMPVMVFRGHLFRALDGSSSRARRFKYGR